MPQRGGGKVDLRREEQTQGRRRQKHESACLQCGAFPARRTDRVLSGKFGHDTGLAGIRASVKPASRGRSQKFKIHPRRKNLDPDEATAMTWITRRASGGSHGTSERSRRDNPEGRVFVLLTHAAESAR